MRPAARNNVAQSFMCNSCSVGRERLRHPEETRGLKALQRTAVEFGGRRPSPPSLAGEEPSLFLEEHARACFLANTLARAFWRTRSRVLFGEHARACFLANTLARAFWRTRSRVLFGEHARACFALGRAE